MSTRFHRHGGHLGWPHMTPSHMWWVISGLLVLLATHAHAQDTPTQTPSSSTSQVDIAWLPDASIWPQVETMLHDMLARPPLGAQGVSWQAERCTLNAQGATQSCETFRRVTTDATLCVGRVSWDDDGNLVMAEGITLSTDTLTLNIHTTTPKGLAYTHSGVRLNHSSSPLHLNTATWSSTATHNRLNELTWSVASSHEHTPLITATHATLERDASTWRLNSVQYGTWIRRAELSESQSAPTLGILPPRVLVARGEVLLGEEAVLAALSKRALFAGIFIAPQSSSFGASLGVGAPFENHAGHITHPPEVAPLRLQLGIDQDKLVASVHGDTTWAWSATDHVTLHAEEGHEPWLTKSVLAEAGALRSWRQSRVGLALGSEETVLQAAGVHDSAQGWWGAYLSAGGYYEMTRSGGFDFSLEHRTEVDGERDQIHRTEVTPGWAAKWGARDKLHASVFAGLGIMQQSSESSELVGIATSNRMAALSMAQAGASFEGRGAHLTHRIEPQATLYLSPLSWSRRLTTPEDLDQTRTVQTMSQTQLGGVMTLHQSLENVSHRVGVEVPFSLMSWRAFDGASAPPLNLVMMSDARAFYRTRSGTKFTGGVWWCGGAAGCDEDILMGHAGITTQGRWHVDYLWGAVTAEQLTWRWIAHTHHTTSAVNAGLWQDVFATNVHADSPSTHAIRASLKWGALSMSAMGFGGVREEATWGGMSRLSYALRRTGWHVDTQVSVHEGDSEERQVGLGLSWGE